MSRIITDDLRLKIMYRKICEYREDDGTIVVLYGHKLLLKYKEMTYKPKQ